MLFLAAGASGFGHAPISKGVVLASSLASIAFWYADGKGHKVTNQILLQAKQAFALRSLAHALLCLPLLYNFRVMERRVGGSNFLAFVLFSTLTSYAFKIACCTMNQAARWEQGPIPLTLALVPAVLTNISIPEGPGQGLPISEKMFVLLLALQLAVFDGSASLLPALSGLLPGLLYASGAFALKRRGRFLLPPPVRRFLRRLAPPTVRISGSTTPTPSSASDAPAAAQGAGGTRAAHVSDEHIATLAQMGFSEEAARGALARADNSLDGALGLLIS